MASQDIPSTLTDIIQPLLEAQEALYRQGLSQLTITLTHVLIQLDFSPDTSPLILVRPFTPEPEEHPSPQSPSSDFDISTYIDEDTVSNDPTSPFSVPFDIHPADSPLPGPAPLEEVSDVSIIIDECTRTLQTDVSLSLNLPSGLDPLDEAVHLALRLTRRNIRQPRLKLAYYNRLGELLGEFTSSQTKDFKRRSKWSSPQYHHRRTLATHVNQIFSTCGNSYIQQTVQVTVARIATLTDQDMSLVLEVLNWHHHGSPEAQETALGL